MNSSNEIKKQSTPLFLIDRDHYLINQRKIKRSILHYICGRINFIFVMYNNGIFLLYLNLMTTTTKIAKT
jgi:hypothetical protein